MGAQRTSNKDIADKLDTLIGLLTAQAQARVTSEPAVVTEPDATPVIAGEINIPQGYKVRMSQKAQEHANVHKEGVMLYARRNLQGQVKLAYCLASRWETLRDNGLIGPVAKFTPSK